MAVTVPNRIEAVGKTVGGKSVLFQKLLSCYLDSDRFTPADSLEFSVLDELGTDTFVSVKLSVDGILLFDGIVDVQTRHIGFQGNYFSFVCRSRVCLMLDNEVKPYWYFNLTSDQMIQTHALPYGAKGAKLPHTAVLPRILAGKGISHWEFIEQYCQQAYQRLPYIDRDGIICCTPFHEKIHFFSNRKAGCFSYENASVKTDRYRIISKLYLKTGKDDYGAAYSHVMTSNLAERYGVVRERYYNPPREWEEKAQLSGERMIYEKQRDHFEISLDILGIHDIRVGDSAEFDDGKGWYSSLYVSQIRQSCDSKGCITKLKLWNRNAAGE